MLLPLVLPLLLLLLLPFVGGGATSILLILAPFSEGVWGQSRTSRALTFIANFFPFCSTFLLRPVATGLTSIRHFSRQLAGQCPCCTFPNRLQTGYALRKRV